MFDPFKSDPHAAHEPPKPEKKPGQRREGYNRPKDSTSRSSQYFWGVVMAAATIFALVSGAYPVLLLDILGLGMIVWLEWSATCEDRVKVKKVNIILGTAIAALALHAERGEREAEANRQESERRYAQQCRDEEMKDFVRSENEKMRAHQEYLNRQGPGWSGNSVT